VAAVSAIVNLTPWQILWELPLADGLLYQAEKWLQDGFVLRRGAPSDIINATQFFQ
jgi:hypothetical protein